MEWKEFINKFDKIKGRLDITIAHLYITLKCAKNRHGVSRYLLMKEMELGEASSRTLLKKLKEMGVLKPLRGGHILTDKGNRVFDSIARKIGEYEIEDFVKGLAPCIHLVIIREYRKWPDTVSIRDNIIRFGGRSAMILFKKNGEIIFPDSGDKLIKYYPNLDEYLNNALKMKDGDLVIISGGNNCLESRLSALNAALALL